MGDMGEVFGCLKEANRARKVESYEENMEVLFQSEFNFPRRFDANKESRVVLFREKRKPKVNFFPSTNRWVVDNKVKYGNAEAFLAWYRKQ